ncbi:MAG: hypothetical protein SGI89_14195 [bacterium]|nr:hypothetical protein [bacterium]
MRTKIFITAVLTLSVSLGFAFFKSNPVIENETIDINEFGATVFVYNGPNYVQLATVTLRQGGSIVYTTTNGTYGKAFFPSVTNGYYDIWAIKPGLGSGHLTNQHIGGGESFTVYITDFE